MICEICGAETQKGKRSCSKSCSYELRARTRKTVHQPLDKFCEVCHLIFTDTTKKKLSTRCKDCSYSMGAQVRIENGSYERTSEQNKKLSDTLRIKHAEGRHFSAAGIQRLSIGLSERWRSEEFRAKVKQGYVRNCGAEHFMKTDAGRQEASHRSLGKKLSSEARMNMSQAAAKRIRERRNTTSNFYGRGGFREDIGLYVRSSWEANFARTLIHEGKAFEYEPDSFTLQDGRVYTPDFKVDNIFYEVKGWWTESARSKFDAFKEQFPSIEMKIIGPDEYNILKDKYSKLIIHWET